MINTDSITIDASQGLTKNLTILNVGNGDLTSVVKFVSDTNIKVVSDARAAAHDSLHVTIQMQHTLAATVDAFFVLQFNDYRHPNALDTIDVSMIGQPAGVRDRENISPTTISLYPNPIRRGSILKIDAFDHSSINVIDAMGDIVIKTNSGIIHTETLMSGMYWVKGVKFVVQ